MMNIFIGIVIQKLFESTVEMETLNNQLSEVPRHPTPPTHPQRGPRPLNHDTKGGWHAS